MKEPKAGSRKADVFKAMKSGGYDAGLAKGIALGLQETTIRSWAPAWGVVAPPRSNKGDPKAPRPAKAPKAPAEGATAAPPKGPQEWVPFFKYASHGAAERAIAGVCKRSGCAPRAYHVIEQGGQYAYAPAHYKPAKPAPAFNVGDHVVDAITPGVTSRVVITGQLTYRIVDPDGAERAVSPYYLEKTDAPKKVTKAKAKPKAKAQPKAKAKTGAKKK